MTFDPINYISRKFLLAVYSLASNTWLVYSEAITPAVYSAVVVAVTAAYFTVNVLDTASTPKTS